MYSKGRDRRYMCILVCIPIHYANNTEGKVYKI